MKSVGRVNVVLLLIIAVMSGFTGLQYLKGLSPQETVSRSIHVLLHEHETPAWIDGFPEENRGVIMALSDGSPPDGPLTADRLAAVFGIHDRAFETGTPVVTRELGVGEQGGITYTEAVFEAYDSVAIPFYQLQPPDFDPDEQYPTLVLFSGHGNMDQVAFDQLSYQKGAGVDLARAGFLVFTMENRGMGKLGYLGNHRRIDAVARLSGGSWHGEITTDALTLLNLVFQRDYVDEARVGVGGVSSGGALSMRTAALDGRIAAAYVQGQLGSYRTTFGTSGAHDTCSNIHGILNHFDMKDIGAMAFPTHLLFVNGKLDTFDYRDAENAFPDILDRYRDGGEADRVSLLTPARVAHEFSTELAVDFFDDVLRH